MYCGFHDFRIVTRQPNGRQCVHDELFARDEYDVWDLAKIRISELVIKINYSIINRFSIFYIVAVNYTLNRSTHRGDNRVPRVGPQLHTFLRGVLVGIQYSLGMFEGPLFITKQHIDRMGTTRHFGTEYRIAEAVQRFLNRIDIVNTWIGGMSCFFVIRRHAHAEIHDHHDDHDDCMVTISVATRSNGEGHHERDLFIYFVTDACSIRRDIDEFVFVREIIERILQISVHPRASRGLSPVTSGAHINSPGRGRARAGVGRRMAGCRMPGDGCGMPGGGMADGGGRAGGGEGRVRRWPGEWGRDGAGPPQTLEKV
jgi:hypothetical protein